MRFIRTLFAPPTLLSLSTSAPAQVPPPPLHSVNTSPGYWQVPHLGSLSWQETDPNLLVVGMCNWWREIIEICFGNKINVLQFWDCHQNVTRTWYFPTVISPLFILAVSSSTLQIVTFHWRPVSPRKPDCNWWWNNSMHLAEAIITS